ncbi:MAG: HAMP domain-containing sensor histidine kinase [Rhodospirillaceae bacterium]
MDAKAISLLVFGVGAVFILDISTPLPLAAGVVYLLLLFIGLDHKNPRLIYYLAVLASALTIIGFFLPVIPQDVVSALINRGLSLCAIAIVTVLLVHYRRQRSARTAAMEALEAATRAAEQGRRDALAASQAKSTFLALANHEMRTPLHSITGYAQLILQADDPPDEVQMREYVEEIQQAGQRLLRVINDVLSLARASDGKLTTAPGDVDIVAEVRSCATELELASPAAGIEITVSGDVPAITGDARAIRRSLLAVMENAVKFSPQGAAVRIRVEGTGNGVRVTVSDTGIGISPEVIGQVGTPFLQEDGKLSRRYEGMGLGLALTKTFVEAHGGTLDISSATGCGTTVTITLGAGKKP